MSNRYSVVPLALWLLASSGCAGSLQRSVEAYERGDFREAHELLARVEPGEGAELREAVAEGIEYSTSYLLSQAWVGLERSRGPKPYREAFAYYNAALGVMPNGHPRRAATLESIAEVERGMAEVRTKHRQALLRFEAVTEERDYRGAIALLGELVELMRSIGANQPSPADVIALAESAIGDGEHEAAVQLVELADLVRRETYTTIGGHDMGEIARMAAALRYFARIDEEATEVASARRTTRRKAPVRKPEVRKPEVRKPEVSEPTAALDTSAMVAEREAHILLARARKKWTVGNKYDALRIVDDAIAVLGDGYGLNEQRQRWQPMRALLIADYIEQGELALSRESTTEARGWYERILVLQPGHELARDRMRKLDKLQELQSGNR